MFNKTFFIFIFNYKTLILVPPCVLFSKLCIGTSETTLYCFMFEKVYLKNSKWMSLLPKKKIARKHVITVPFVFDSWCLVLKTLNPCWHFFFHITINHMK